MKYIANQMKNKNKLIIPKKIVTVDKNNRILSNTAVEIKDDKINAFIHINKFERRDYE